MVGRKVGGGGGGGGDKASIEPKLDKANKRYGTTSDCSLANQAWTKGPVVDKTM